jgi:hypothetical protein
MAPAADANDANDGAEVADPCAPLFNRKCDPPDAGITCHVQVLECPSFQSGGYSFCVCEAPDAADSSSSVDASNE